jgi:hypothetical protein
MYLRTYILYVCQSRTFTEKDSKILKFLKADIGSLPRKQIFGGSNKIFRRLVVNHTASLIFMNNLKLLC